MAFSTTTQPLFQKYVNETYMYQMFLCLMVYISKPVEYICMYTSYGWELFVFDTLLKSSGLWRETSNELSKKPLNLG